MHEDELLGLCHLVHNLPRCLFLSSSVLYFFGLAIYDDFPIVTYNLTEDQQESLTDVVKLALSENREITKAEIDKFQPDDDIDF